MDCPTSQDASNTMTQYKFNLMARSVNKDFVQLGYPTILTNKDGRDFVSLCALMQNCSTLLSAFKTKGSLPTPAPGMPADSCCAKLPVALDQSANNKAGKSASSAQAKKRGGIFSSSSRSLKQIQQQNAESLAKLTTEVARAMQFDEEFASVYEGIAETVRRDAEFVIETTRCLPELEPAPTAAEGDQPPPQPPSRDHQILTFFSTRWVRFRETLTHRLTEATRLATELQSLKPFGGKGMRSKSASGDIGAATDLTSEGYGEPTGQRRGQARLSRQRSLSHVSVTKIPSLEAEIRRLKLEMNRREQRHKEELDQQAKERERLNREFRLAQRRNLPPTRLAPGGHHPQHHQQQLLAHQSHSSSEGSEKILSEVCQTLDALAESLASQTSLTGGGGKLTSPPLAVKPAGDRKNSQHQLPLPNSQQIQVYAESVCNAALSRIHGLQSDCHTSRRRQADLEVLISILKARLDLSNDQLSDVAKFESVVNDIARRLTNEVSAASHQVGQVGQVSQVSLSQQSRAAQAGGDDHRDSLVSRLTHRLRERQRPSP